MHSIPFHLRPRAAMVAQRDRWKARGEGIYPLPGIMVATDVARYWNWDLPDLYLAELRREQARLLMRLAVDPSGQGERWLFARLDAVAADLARRRRVGTDVPPTPARPTTPPQPLPSAPRVKFVWKD